LKSTTAGKTPAGLEAFLEEQVEAEKAMVASDVVRQAIEASGLSLAELARQAGINHGQLSRFMRGERSLTLATLDPLAKILRLRMVRGKAPRKK
jgi:DNA-binding phage protein